MSDSIRFTDVLRLFRGRLPGQLIIQVTDQCNARCPQCAMRVTERFPRSTLPIDRVKRIIDAAAEKKIRALSFTGGEPLLLLDTVAELIRHAGRAGIPYIRTGTNGYLFRNPDAPGYLDRVRRVADVLADTPLRNFWVSIDSAVPEVHDEMRGFGGLARGVERALPHFHERGIYPSANLGINRNVGGTATWNLSPANHTCAEAYHDVFYEGFLNAFRGFYRFVRDMGFTMANTCYPMSVEPGQESGGLQAVYGATATDRIVRFTRAEKALLFKALLVAVPEFRPQLRIFSPLVSLYALCREYAGIAHYAYACHGGRDFFFVDARDGNTYPCGYRGGENLGAFESLDLAARGQAAACRDCDWECFRDPSEIMGPFLDLARRPHALLGRLHKDPNYRVLWMEDLRYYRACRFFNGRVPTEHARMQDYACRAQSPQPHALPV